MSDIDRRQNKTQSSVFERHAQTMIGLVIVSLVLWIGATVQELTQSSAVMVERMSNVRDQVNNLNKAMIENNRIQADRIIKIEERVFELERHK